MNAILLRAIRDRARRTEQAYPDRSQVWYGARNLVDACAVAMADPRYASDAIRSVAERRALQCAGAVAMVRWARSMAVAS